MIQNSAFAIQLLEKIGAPLAAAIEAVPLKGDNQDVEAAQLIAQMLGQSVQVSIALSNSMNIKESEEQADSTRLALAALAAPLIADFYRKNERPPEDQDIKRMVKSQEAVLAFAENFAPAANSASRLVTVDHDAPLFDETQPSLVVLQILAPVINAIAEFPFGQGEIKLVQDVSTRLEKNAADMAKEMGGADKLSELLIFKGLAQIYADCHRGETARLATASDEDRGELSLAPVWDAYETRRAMAEALIDKTGLTAAVSTASPAPASEAPAQPAPQAPTQQPAPAAQPSTPPASSGGPMGFFKPGAKPAEPAQETKSVPNPLEAPAQPAPQTDQPPATNTSTPQSPPASSGGPMGFFKPGAKKEEDDGNAAS